MKKLLILSLMVLVGISLVSLSYADEARTIPMKSKGVASKKTLVLANGADVFLITGYAGSANCTYSVHDVASIGDSQMTLANVMAEGGEATQYDSVPNVDFGSEGLSFANGVAVNTTTCELSILYR